MTDRDEAPHGPSRPTGRRSISQEVSLTFLLVSVLPLGVTIAALLWVAVAIRMPLIVQSQDALAEQVAGRLQNQMDNTTSQLASLAKVRGLNNLSGPEAKEELSRTLIGMPTLSSLTYVSLDGQIISSVSNTRATGTMEAPNLADLPELRAAIDEGRAAWTVEAEVDRLPAILLAVPVQDPRTGEATGYVFADAHLQDYDEVLRTIGKISGVTAFLVNEEGLVTLHENLKVIRTTGQLETPIATGLVRNSDGEWVIRGTAPFRGGTAVVEQPAATALAPVWVSLLVVILLVLIALGTGFWMRHRLNRRVVDPIIDVAETAGQLREGNLGARAEPGETREVAILANALNDMAAAQQAQTVDLESRNAELRRSNHDLRQFASVASHDLQSPLRRIISYLDLIEDSHDITPEMADDFEVVTSSARRMRRLVEDLLTYARLGTGEGIGAIDCSSLLDEQVSDLRETLDDIGGQIEVGPLPTVFASEARISRLFQNLLENAVTYRSPDRPLHVTVTSRDLVGGWAEFAVTDNGLGIKREEQETAFRIFGRLSRETEGTGIGLAICRRIVESYGGEIAIISPPRDAEVGTTIRFTLPTQDAEARQ